MRLDFLRRILQTNRVGRATGRRRLFGIIKNSLIKGEISAVMMAVDLRNATLESFRPCLGGTHTMANPGRFLTRTALLLATAATVGFGGCKKGKGPDGGHNGGGTNNNPTEISFNIFSMTTYDGNAAHNYSVTGSATKGYIASSSGNRSVQPDAALLTAMSNPAVTPIKSWDAKGADFKLPENFYVNAYDAANAKKEIMKSLPNATIIFNREGGTFTDSNAVRTAVIKVMSNTTQRYSATN
jgi:hypothetical protein